MRAGERSSWGAWVGMLGVDRRGCCYLARGVDKTHVFHTCTQPQCHGCPNEWKETFYRINRVSQHFAANTKKAKATLLIPPMYTQSDPLPIVTSAHAYIQVPNQASKESPVYAPNQACITTLTRLPPQYTPSCSHALPPRRAAPARHITALKLQLPLVDILELFLCFQ